MKCFILFAVIIMLSLSCNPIMYPLPDKNYDEISNIKSKETADSAWGIVCRVLTAQGCVRKEGDKNTGIITTDKYDFGMHFSFVRDGKPIDSTAWVALSYVKNKGGFDDKQFHVFAHWNVEIKPLGTVSTVSRELSIVDASTKKPQKKSFHPEQEYTFPGQSTGVFEKMLADAVK